MSEVISNYLQIKRKAQFDNGKLPGHLAEQRAVSTSGTVRPIDYINGVLHGIDTNNNINTSTDNGVTWTVRNTVFTASVVTRMFYASDGELVVVTTAAIYKTSGWATNPATATLSAAKVSTTDGGNTPLNEFSVDGNGTKFIAMEYGTGLPAPNSRKAWISVNSGTTWTEVYDSVTTWTALVADPSHGHGCCYDSVADRFWLSEGHVNVTGSLLFSDDDGATWNTVSADNFPDSAAPTTLIAATEGIYMGTDSGYNGIYFLPRGGTIAEQQAKVAVPIWRWRQGPDETWAAPDGLAGFANKMVFDPVTDILYTCWNTAGGGQPGILTASDSLGGAIIYNHGADTIIYNVAVYDNKIAMKTSTNYLYGVAKKSSSILDTGACLGGNSVQNTSLAVGNYADCSDASLSLAVGGKVTTTGLEKVVIIGMTATVDAARTVVIGYGASAAATDSIVIGNAAAGTAAFSIVIGAGASAGEDSVSIGDVASAAGANVVIGRGASGTAANVVAIGFSANADSNGTAIGHDSNATGVLATAIGKSANAASTYNFAAGYLATCTGALSMAVGGNATTGALGNAVALGTSSAVTAASGIAIGTSASCGHAASIALGYSVATTADAQVELGAKHIELSEVTEPAAPAANGGRLYLKDDGAGKTQLCIRFATGAVQVLATEP